MADADRNARVSISSVNCRKEEHEESSLDKLPVTEGVRVGMIEPKSHRPGDSSHDEC